VTTSDDESKVSEDRREALRYALAIGSGAALASALASPASAQASPDNTLDRIRANKVLRIAVLPGELPYFNKDLATGTWSGFSIEMANDMAKLLDVKLEYTESTYGNSILDLQSNKIDLGFALNPTPQRALVVDFTATVFPHPFGAMLRKGLEAKTWADVNKPEVNIAVDVGSANETIARRFAPNATIKSLKSRDEVMLEMSSGAGRLRRQRAGAGPDGDRQEPESRQLQDPAIALGRDSLQHGGTARAGQALARFPVGVGRLQPRHRPDARMVRQGAVALRRQAGRRAGRTQYLRRLSIDLWLVDVRFASLERDDFSSNRHPALAPKFRNAAKCRDVRRVQLIAATHSANLSAGV
jgi:Bacterial extracellular solute-binding proteins, family 3